MASRTLNPSLTDHANQTMTATNPDVAPNASFWATQLAVYTPPTATTPEVPGHELWRIPVLAASDTDARSLGDQEKITRTLVYQIKRHHPMETLTITGVYVNETDQGTFVELEANVKPSKDFRDEHAALKAAQEAPLLSPAPFPPQ